MVKKILKSPVTILFSVVLGIVFGIFEKNAAISLGPIGDLYLKFFQMTVIPILVTSIVASLAQLMKDEAARQHIIKIVLVFIVMLFLTSVLSTIVGLVAKPGQNLGESAEAVLDTIIKANADDGADIITLKGEIPPQKDANAGLVEFFLNIVPSNIFAAFSNGSILELVFFSIVFGVAIGFINDKRSQGIIHAVLSLKESFQKIINWTMLVLPVGLFFLIGKQIADVGVEVLLAMIKFIVVFYVIGLIAMLICTVAIWIRSGEKNPITVIRKLLNPIVICFATRNSFAALPSSVDALSGLNLNKNTVDMVLPLGITVLRFGNIMYFALGACFVTQIYNASIQPASLVLIVLGSILAGTATAGASGLLTLPLISLILDPMGLPVESILVIFMAIDSLIDPMRTLLIVYVNIATTALIADRETEEEKLAARQKYRETLGGTVQEVLHGESAKPQAVPAPAFASQQAPIQVSAPPVSAAVPVAAAPVAQPFQNPAVLPFKTQAQPAAPQPATAFIKTRKGLKIRIRDALILINTLLIIATTAIIIRINSQSTQDSVYSVSEKLVTEILKSVDNKVEWYYGPAEQQLRDIGFHYWSDSEFNFLKNQELALDYFLEIMKTHPEFAMIYFADTKGNLVMGRRMPDGSLTRRYVTRTKDAVLTRFVHENREYNATFPNTRESLDKGYDPRSRGWYQNAVQKRGVAWTDVYIFATDNMPGFSCAMPIYQVSGELEGVICIDIGIRDLSLYLGGISTTENSQLFIFDHKNQIIARPIQQRESLDILFNIYPNADGSYNYLLKKVDDTNTPIIKTAFESAPKEGNQLYSFSLDGRQYFAKIDSIPLDELRSIQVGMVVPDEDIMGVVYKNQRITIIISFMVVIIAVIISFVISTFISKPMKVLSTAMDDIRELKITDSEENIDSGIREIDMMVESFYSMKQGLQNFKKYVPSDLVAQLVRNNKSAKIGGEKQHLTLLFSDIENFTGISEKVAPEELVNRLYEYFSLFEHTINDNSGTLDKYIGDSIMAFWGAPLQMSPAESAMLACRTALTCQRLGFDLSNAWAREGKDRFRTRFGIHTGEVIVGNMGSDERINYTVLGDNVNLASRLEGINKYYGTEIIVSSDTLSLVKDAFEFRVLDKIIVKGMHRPVYVYELLAEKGRLDQNLLKVYRQYEAGFKRYLGGDWDGCIECMNTVIQANGDMAAKVIKERAEGYKLEPPAKWNGVYVFDKK